MLALRAAHRRGINDTITLTAQTPRVVAPTNPAVNVQGAYRQGVMRATQLRQSGHLQESIAELERTVRMVPPGGDEFGRLQEVIAESRFDADDMMAARQAAEAALTRFPTSVLALRVKRDALVELDDIPTAIPVARALAHVDNKPERWAELCELCDSNADHMAMYQFAQEGLKLHPNHPTLVTHRDRAKANLPPGAVPADDGKPSWWRRAVGAITGRPPTKPPPVSPVDVKLDAILGELAKGSTIVDRTLILQQLRTAYGSADRDDARVFALAAALKDSAAVSNLPSDQDLLALLRRALS
jgi:hypothetical protein